MARFAVLGDAGRAWWRGAFGVAETEAWLRGENPAGYGTLAVGLVDRDARRKREPVRLVVDVDSPRVSLGVRR